MRVLLKLSKVFVVRKSLPKIYAVQFGKLIFVNSTGIVTNCKTKIHKKKNLLRKISLQSMPQACVSRSGCPITVIDLMPTTQSIMTPASARVCISTNRGSKDYSHRIKSPMLHRSESKRFITSVSQ